MTTVNLQTAAELLGKSVNTLKSWFRQGCPVVVKGNQNREWEISISDVVAWREQQAINNAIGDTAMVDADELKQRKLAAETSIAEIDAAKARGEVLELEAVTRIITDDYITLKQRLRQIPQRIAPIIVGETDEALVKDEIANEIDDALTELASQYYSESDDSEGEDQQATPSSKAAA